MTVTGRLVTHLGFAQGVALGCCPVVVHSFGTIGVALGAATAKCRRFAARVGVL